MPGVCLVGLAAAGHSGVPRYAATLTAALGRVTGEFPDLTLTLLSTAAGAREIGALEMEVELVRGPLRNARAGPGRIIAEQMAVRHAKSELLHFFDLTGPLLVPGRRFVTTIHDAAIRHGFERTRVAHKHIMQPWAIRHAAAIVAVSAFAKQEAVELFDADEAKVTVIHSGPGLASDQAGPEAHPGLASDQAGPEAHPGLASDHEGPGDHAGPGATNGAPFLLYVGNISAHKNLPFLVQAFTQADVDTRLVLVGRRGERFEEVEAEIERSGARERIELRRGASDGELDRLYRSASALLLPSRYEGFGFTALEAMARGCPVLASDIPAVREVSGEGAWLLPVDDQPAWVSAIRGVLADRELGAGLKARGARTVARYSWERTARDLCGLFLRVVDENG